MEGFKVIQLIAMLSTLPIIPITGQMNTPCTGSLTSSFTPCLNFVTGSTANGSSPTTSCCDSLKSLMSSSMDCACLIINANVPVQLPINRTLAISLPRSCGMKGVPVLCKASGTPLPAPGPALFGPTLSPPADAPFSFSRRASKAVAMPPTLAPESEPIPQLTPASPPVETETPTATPGIRPVLTPSASNPSYLSTPSLMLLAEIMIFKFY